MASNLTLLVVCTGSLVAGRSAGAAPGDAEPTDAPTAAAPSSRSYEEWTRAEKPDRLSYGWNDPTLKSGIGVGVSIGGGIGGFTDRTMRDTMTNRVAGLGGVRASFGTQVPLGIEISYLGMAGHINTIAGQPNGTLVGTTFEGVLRYNVLPHNLVSPYLFTGLGWQYYSVWSVQFAQADTGLRGGDHVMSVPSGAGFTVHDASGVNLDVRGTFRATTDSTLVLDPTGGYAKLYSWGASADLGYEF